MILFNFWQICHIGMEAECCAIWLWKWFSHKLSIGTSQVSENCLRMFAPGQISLLIFTFIIYNINNIINNINTIVADIVNEVCISFPPLLLIICKNQHLELEIKSLKERSVHGSLFCLNIVKNSQSMTACSLLPLPAITYNSVFNRLETTTLQIILTTKDKCNHAVMNKTNIF